jgi:ribosomal protein L29
VIEVSKVRIDGGTQSRAAINEQTVAEYSEAMEDPNTVFPPITVYFDGKDYWLADGFHRLAAWQRVGRTEVPAEIRQGDRRKAILHSCAANAAHGLRRTNDDKRRAVMTLIEDEEWGQWSNREIARRCGVSDVFVAKVRDGASANGLQMSAERKVERGGTTYTVDTSNIGKTKPDSIPSETQGATTADPDIAGDGSQGSRQPQADADVTRADEQAPEAGEQTPVAAGESPAPAPLSKVRAELRKLTREALEDEVEGLREECAELRARVKKQTGQIADLKAKIKDLESDDKNAVIARQSREIEHLRSQMFRANEAARVKTVAARKAQDEAKGLREKLEGQEIRLS